MGYFAFPLKVDNFMLRHEMPTGDMRPGVNSDINDPGQRAVLHLHHRLLHRQPVDRCLQPARLGRHLRRSQRAAGVLRQARHRREPKAAGMSATTPRNPGSTAWRSTTSGRPISRRPSRAAWSSGTRCAATPAAPGRPGNAETFGAETASPLRASVIAGAQPGHGFDAAKGQFVGISEANVVLTTAKMAEANGEGIILRFNEIKGEATSVKVDLGWFAPVAVTETDLVENDKAPVTLADGVISFTIQPFGFKTFRLIRGTAPQAVAGVTAAFDAKGCLVSWKDQPDAACFEVFRGTRADFKPGTGTYVATVSANHYYDPTVKDRTDPDLLLRRAGRRRREEGGFPAPVQAVPGLAADTTAPSAPVLAGEALHATKVTLSWQPSTDNFAVKGYQVYRDGTQIADLAAVFNSWMDDAVKPGTTYRYTVKACDIAGNLSPDGGPAAVTTLR